MTAGLALRFMKIMLLYKLGLRRAGAEAFFRLACERQSGGNDFDRVTEEVRESVRANAAALGVELKAGTGERIKIAALQALRCPVAIIVGSDTAPFLSAAAERLRKAVPSFRFFDERDTGHVMNVLEPERFAAVVSRVLEDFKSRPGVADRA
jgi:pimeloyl-ACP methyl ester carboxylesterase